MHQPTLVFAIILSFVPLAGCAGRRPEPEAELAAARAAGLGEAIAFREEGGPLDEAAAGETLALGDALRRALSTDPRLQAALARVRIAIAEADQARLLPNPVLDVVVRWGSGEPQIEASLTEEIIGVLSIPRRASAADQRLRQSAAEAVTTALDVTAELRERYASVQSLEALALLLDWRSAFAARLAEAARERLAAGEGTRGDTAALEAQRVALEVDIHANRIELREARLRLARSIGEPSSTASWRLDPWQPPAAPQPAESKCVEVALANRPELQAAVWELAALGDESALAWTAPFDGSKVGFDAERDGDWSTGAAVSVPIPIFDLGQAERARAMAAIIEGRHELTLARRKVVEEVRVAHQTLTATLDNLRRIREELVPLSEERRRLAAEVYAVERDITPLLLAEQDLLEAKERAIDAERRSANAFLQLERAVGGAGSYDSAQVRR